MITRTLTQSTLIVALLLQAGLAAAQAGTAAREGAKAVKTESKDTKAVKLPDLVVSSFQSGGHEGGGIQSTVPAAPANKAPAASPTKP